MSHANLLAQLLPPGSYAPNAKLLSVELKAEGAQLDAVQLSAQGLLNGVTPFLAGPILVDWERLLGLEPAGGYQQRLQAVLAKLAETGGLSIPYFIELARAMGYAISINELQPFWVDYSHCDQDVIYEEDVIWVWQVLVDGSQGAVSYSFYADASCVGDRLLSFGDPVIEAVFEDLKPAHTFVYFAYQ